MHLDNSGIQLTLSETEVDSGVFRGSVTFDALTSDQASGRLLAPEGAAVLARFDDPDSSIVLLGEALVGNDQLFADSFE